MRRHTRTESKDTRRSRTSQRQRQLADLALLGLRNKEKRRKGHKAKWMQTVLRELYEEKLGLDLASTLALSDSLAPETWNAVKRHDDVLRETLKHLKSAAPNILGWLGHWESVKDSPWARCLLLDIVFATWGKDRAQLSEDISRLSEGNFSALKYITHDKSHVTKNGWMETILTPIRPSSTDILPSSDDASLLARHVETLSPKRRSAATYNMASFQPETVHDLKQCIWHDIGIKEDPKELIFELSNIYKGSPTYQFEQILEIPRSVCITADCKNNVEIEFKIKTHATEGLRLIEKYRVPIHASEALKAIPCIHSEPGVKT